MSFTMMAATLRFMQLLRIANNPADRQEARQFNADLNRLMAEKARAFDGRNGVKVLYSEQVFRPTLPLGPEHISRFDCYHPSRAGQLFLADQMWRGFGRNSTQAFDVLAEDFQAQDYCSDGQRNWNGCWVEHNDDDRPWPADELARRLANGEGHRARQRRAGDPQPVRALR